MEVRAVQGEGGVKRTPVRRDANHQRIADRFAALGCSVEDLSASRVTGIADLLVGLLGRDVHVEVKNPNTAYGRRGLSESQQRWARDWRGAPTVAISTEDEADALVQNLRKGATKHTGGPA